MPYACEHRQTTLGKWTRPWQWALVLGHCGYTFLMLFETRQGLDKDLPVTWWKWPVRCVVQLGDSLGGFRGDGHLEASNGRRERLRRSFRGDFGRLGGVWMSLEGASGGLGGILKRVWNILEALGALWVASWVVRVTS